ncbi:MAG TPA: amidoligase family protein [Rhodocyclaceae bacterium]|nr:amidoligase family protein [Rhodocyclaceae bacterium]HRQ48293.1 amidoligase family protein [Rhodocyclaceae bacterium]
MKQPRSRLRQPPWSTNAAGQPRRVGIELEMNGLEIDALARIVADQLHTSVAPRGRYERVLSGDPAGDWIVELDFDLLKRLGREQRDADTFGGEIGNSAEDALAWIAEALVPLELVSPPLPLDRLDSVEELIGVLREAGARGTSDRLISAFGMQFNPEIPSEAPEVLTACLKAFLCLYDWLYARADIDMSRRVTNYIDPFPADYVRKVIDPAYAPDMGTLIDDYLADNPTRNRALDLLPLFLHLDENRVRNATDDPLIKARPTFHYRLPDCNIHLPDWGLYTAWNDWVEVERLADDSNRLHACCDAYRDFLDRPLDRWFGDWTREVERHWLSR